MVKQKIIKQTYIIKAPVERVWNALTDPKSIEAWGGGPAKMDDLAGTKFSLWGGDIHGTNTRVVKMREIYQDWFGGKWEKASKVEFRLSKQENGTKIQLTHTGVPEKDFDNIGKGWEDYYLGPLKDFLEKN